MKNTFKIEILGKCNLIQTIIILIKAHTPEEIN